MLVNFWKILIMEGAYVITFFKLIACNTSFDIFIPHYLYILFMLSHITSFLNKSLIINISYLSF